MGEWISNHLSPARYAYRFLNDYQETAGSASLNHSGDFTFEVAITPKEDQLDYALALKGELANNPRQNLSGHTLFLNVEGGLLRGKIFSTEATYGNGLEFITLNPVVMSNDILYIAVTLKFFTKELFVYVNGIPVSYSILSIGTSGFQTISSLTQINTSSFPTVYNNATSKIIIGKALGFNQFEGVIHDHGYHSKAKSSVEINSTWNQIKNPTPPTLTNIIFGSTRLTSPVKNRLWKMDEKGGNQAMFLNLAFGIENARINKSNNLALNATKLTAYGVGSNGIITADADGGNLQIYGTNCLDASLNYTLTKIVYAKYTGVKYDIFLADFNSTTNVISNEVNIISYSGNGNFNHYHPTFSPDGTKILMRRVHVGTGYEYLSTILLDGTNLVDLVAGTENDDFYYPIYNKQNTKIGYSQRTNNGTFGYQYSVFTMDAEGGNIKQISGDGYDCMFNDFSPDGNSIIFQQLFYNLYYMLFKCDLNGRNRQNLSGVYYSGYSDTFATWY